jgi:hypothetical protein
MKINFLFYIEIDNIGAVLKECEWRKEREFARIFIWQVIRDALMYYLRKFA